ncbi:MAG TPA: hypothetical protein PLD02_16705 [Saprospiraceae bacterium]|nr:hypothetical protein [Saprospiraceae bacterium]
MLSKEEKIDYLRDYLSKDKENYSDTFKDDILIFFDEDFSVHNLHLNFLDKYNSKEEIEKWVDRLLSRFVLKFDDEFEQENDFIHDYLVNG